MFVISDLVKRYDVEDVDIFEVIREKSEEFMDGVKKDLTFNEAAVKKLDKIFEYEEPVQEISEEQQKIEKLEHENEILHSQVDELKAALEDEKTLSNEYQQELDKLQVSVSTIKEGYEGTSSTLVKKYKDSSDRFEKQYKDLQEKYSEMVKQTNERIANYEVRIAGYEERLREISKLQQQQFVNTTKLDEAFKKETKLNSELSKKESEINSLVLDKSKAEELCQKAVQQSELIKTFMYETADKLEAVSKHIRNSMENEQLPVINVVASMSEDPTIPPVQEPPVFEKKELVDKALPIDNSEPKQPETNNVDTESINEQPEEKPEPEENNWSRYGATAEKNSSDFNKSSGHNIMFDDDEPLEFRRVSNGGIVSNLKKKLSFFQ